MSKFVVFLNAAEFNPGRKKNYQHIKYLLIYPFTIQFVNTDYALEHYKTILHAVVSKDS